MGRCCELERGVQCTVEGDEMGHDIHIIEVYLCQSSTPGLQGARNTLHNPVGANMSAVVGTLHHISADSDQCKPSSS